MAQTDETDELVGRRIGDYRLLEPIGAGGFATVYRAEQPRLGRPVVVKVLHPQLRTRDVVLQRFLREAQLAACLDHPDAAHIYGFDGEADGLVWIAMEYVRGITLKHWLRDRGPMPLALFVPFFEGIADVVQCAHDHGIVHRDLKPSNLMVTERGGRRWPTLLDFGVARRIADATPPTSTPATLQRLRQLGGEPVPEDVLLSFRRGAPSTVTGTSPPPGSDRLTPADTILGTPGYMAPEQWTHAFPVGPAADLYALGVIAYEALTGRRPFPDRTTLAAPPYRTHVPPLGRRLPPALDRVLQRALALRPDHRFATALDLAHALRSASGLDPLGSRCSGSIPRPPHRTR